ncbi:hypothetical protein B0H16DRAFT_1683637 [Mycena metata]|uniref:Uncharacterized protein n=1 Tax=Mycena metata TaxID=1033252 RepID=A0AAD7K4W1_9AGAR|nr:hypothetical protein B0H16DRAFT_1683637 [Mycena metata]
MYEPELKVAPRASEFDAKASRVGKTKVGSTAKKNLATEEGWKRSLSLRGGSQEEASGGRRLQADVGFAVISVIAVRLMITTNLSSTLMTAPTIPIELQERILDHLRGDISVCQAWTPNTRSHLFRRFKVLPHDPDAFRKCGKYVDQVPHLAEYIRELEIQSGPGVLLEQESNALNALCTLLDRTHSLRTVVISTRSSTMQAWRNTSSDFRVSLSGALQRSLSSLTHILLDGFSFAVSDLRLVYGMRRLEYVGLERMGAELDDEISPIPAFDDEPQSGSLRTLTLYFSFSDPGNGPLIAGVIDALHSVQVSHITSLRLGGVIGLSVFEALPPSWLSRVTHLGLELANLRPIPHDISALESFMMKLLPTNQLLSIVTTVAAHGPPVYRDAVQRHYDFCLTRANVVKIQWEDGKLETLEPAFPGLFADGTMQVGKFRHAKCLKDCVVTLDAKFDSFRLLAISEAH